MRAAALHLDRYRGPIDAEVQRQLGRAEPSPHARSEIIRRFRTFCRLASIDLDTAKPSLDGLGGNTSPALERAIELAVEAAVACGPSVEVAEAIRALELRFRAGVRRILQPNESEDRKSKKRRRRTPNAGRRVRSAIDRITDGYIALDLDTGTVHDVNPAAETLFGVDSTQLLHRQLIELVGESSRESFRDLESRLDAGEDSPPTDILLIRPGGEEIAVQVSVANHTISGKRLAIFVARELAETDRKPPSPPARRSRWGFARPTHQRLS